MVRVPITEKGFTIPHTVTGQFGSGRVLLKPASEGTGVIAGGAVRAVITAAGIQNILTKSLGSTTAHNVVKATVDALLRLKAPQRVARLRGRSVEEILGTEPKAEKVAVAGARPCPRRPRRRPWRSPRPRPGRKGASEPWPRPARRRKPPGPSRSR